MKNEKLVRINVIVSVILIIGFALTAVLSYHANYQASMESIEKVSSLTSEGIYYQISAMFTKPVNVSLTMGHDSLLTEHLLEEAERMDDEEYIRKTQDYLEGYRRKYGFDSVFLASAATHRYYNFNGMDRLLEEDEPENYWFYDLLESSEEYDLNIDNDEVEGADNAVTVFVNCKVRDKGGRVLGIVGVGMRIEYLKELLAEYEGKYDLDACLVDADGTIEISTGYTGYENVDYFRIYHQEKIRGEVLDWKKDTKNLELWTDSGHIDGGKSYVVTRYIPELKWHLVIRQDTDNVASRIRGRLWLTCFLVIAVILTVLTVITAVIKRFNRQITELVKEKEAIFRKATEQLYDNIYEINITGNSYVGDRTREYFESLGAKGLPFDQVLRVIAEKQIKEEYREGYISTFSPKNVLREYDGGNSHLRYEFQLTQDGFNYFWMRIDAYIFYSRENECVHMFVYRKNIDEEKKKEKRAELDEMTGFYTKKATERIITSLLEENPGKQYAFIIFDIDNFKTANDQYGHAFGDICIRRFAKILKQQFSGRDILGRIGGDEFVAFIESGDDAYIASRVEELSEALHTTCREGADLWEMSACIGAAAVPEDGSDFETLYRLADKAMYEAKKRGKNGFTIYHRT